MTFEMALKFLPLFRASSTWNDAYSFAVAGFSAEADFSFTVAEGFLVLFGFSFFGADILFSDSDTSCLTAGFFFGFSLLASRELSPNDL